MWSEEAVFSTPKSMPNSKVRTTLQTGLGLAISLVIANSIVVPLISNRPPMDGVVVGLLAGFIALVVYTLMAISQSRGDGEP